MYEDADGVIHSGHETYEKLLERIEALEARIATLEATRDVPAYPVPYCPNPWPPYEVVWTTGKGTIGSLAISGDVPCLAV